MKRLTTASAQLNSSQISRFVCLHQRAIGATSLSTRLSSISRSHLHTTPSTPATVSPITAAAPPPPVPTPAAEHVDSRVARRRKQAELLKKGQDLRSVNAGTGGGTAKQKRFWKDVLVKETDDSLQIYLDKRPLRTPSTAVLSVPKSKPHLASAIALEWDLLVSAQQALRHHLIPLTSLVSRAIDIETEERALESASKDPTSGEIRRGITSMVMRYLSTDTLLCWAPEPPADPPGYETHIGRTESLRSIQIRTAQPIISFLAERVWPGVEIVPILDEGSIMPIDQPEQTKSVIRGWIAGLPAWELAALERGVLAGKGLLVAVRLLVEWSEELAHLREGHQGEKFNIDDAVRASSLEVTYQTDMWGEVEDTHDVQKEDLRRQMGSVVLLVAGQAS